MTQEFGKQGEAAWSAVWSPSRKVSWRRQCLSRDFNGEGQER